MLVQITCRIQQLEHDGQHPETRDGIDYCLYAFTCVAHAVSYGKIRPKLASERMRV